MGLADADPLTMGVEDEIPDGNRAESRSEEVAENVVLRGVVLDSGEEIARVLVPDDGTVDTLPRTGQALVLTNRRIIAFRGVEGFRDTHIADASDLNQYSIRTGQRNWGAVLQGLLMMISGGFLYVVVAYWLTGQISGPNVPFINIDVAPLIALLIVLAGLLVLLQNYFTRPAGAVMLRGRESNCRSHSEAPWISNRSTTFWTKCNWCLSARSDGSRDEKIHADTGGISET